MRILVVEDEENLNNVIVKRLKLENYSVDRSFDGIEAESYIASCQYDLIILDIMLPKKDGLSVIASMREKGNHTPVIMLTALDGISDKVKGLDAGADDYLTKPFSFEELFARMRAVLRKNSGLENRTNIISVDDLVIDLSKRLVTRGGKEIELSGREYSILEYMARNSGIVLTRAQISEHSWSFDYDGGSNIIDVYIRYLRKKIDDGFDIKLIHTVRGSGYVLKNG